MQGETMKIELINHECHTSLGKTVSFAFASAVIINCSYIENSSEEKCILLNSKCLLEMIGCKKLRAKIWLIIKS